MFKNSPLIALMTLTFTAQADLSTEPLLLSHHEGTLYLDLGESTVDLVNGIEIMDIAQTQGDHYCDVYYDVNGYADSTINYCGNKSYDSVEDRFSEQDGWRVGTGQEVKAFFNLFEDGNDAASWLTHWGLGSTKELARETIGYTSRTTEDRFSGFAYTSSSNTHNYNRATDWSVTASGVMHLRFSHTIIPPSQNEQYGTLLVRDWSGETRALASGVSVQDVDGPGVAMLALLCIGGLARRKTK